MGLDIIPAVSKKEYHYGYFGLHMVRHLALMSCHLPEEVCGEDSFNWVTNPWLYGYVMHGKELPSTEIMRKILYAFQASGYCYPNLMFHSDCDGKYTKNGSVFSKPDLQSGNSVGLLKELEQLQEWLTEERRNKHQRAARIFDMLYDIVQDEVKNGKGRLEFC